MGQDFLEKKHIQMSNKSWLILFSKLLYKMGQDYLDIQYVYFSIQELSFSLNNFFLLH